MDSFFDAALLIDCWDEKWLKEQRVLNAREGYGRMCDFLSHTSVGKILYSCGGMDQKIHPIFENVFPEIHRVENILPFKKIVKPGSSILLGGQAFGMCFHYNHLGLIRLLRENYRVFSSPKLINLCHDHINLYKSRNKAFKKDLVSSWVKHSSDIYRASPKMKNVDKTKLKDNLL